uniref:Uncharacterized protein n=1 Tax=viral metagenome TaxID=1070528 RepID=A0A6M3JIV9_9ZZZZ
MSTELRTLTGTGTVVVYTDENKVARQLREMPSCYRMVPYEQEQKGKIALVGWDFYFPRSKMRALLNLGCQKT